MTSDTLVSVLVPSYNGVDHIGPTINSVLGQSHENLELMISDDGSTDGTLELVREMAQRDSRIRIDAHDNIGIFANPIRLLKSASCELVKFVLQDDVLAPTCVERLVAPLASEPSITMSTSKRNMIDANSNRMPDVPATSAIVDTDTRLLGSALGNHLLETVCNRIGELSTVLFRRSAIDVDRLWDFPGCQIRINGDVALWLKLLATGDAWYCTDELSSFRIHDAQFGRRPDAEIDGILDWPNLISGARTMGYLTSPVQERIAISTILQHLVSVHLRMADHPRSLELLDAIERLTARLRMLAPLRLP